MQMIKKSSPAIDPHLAHLINAIYNSEKYPQILKVSRISPTLKPHKNAVNIDSYWPIHSLTAIDKIIEPFIKCKLMNL